jgi:hypothetical protein
LKFLRNNLDEDLSVDRALITWTATQSFKRVDILVAIEVGAVIQSDLLVFLDDTIEAGLVDLHIALFFHEAVQLLQQWGCRLKAASCQSQVDILAYRRGPWAAQIFR